VSTPVIEWGSGTFRGYDPVSRATIEANDLTELLDRMGRPKAVGLALGRRVTLLKYITLPDVGRDQMTSIVELQLEQMFPVGDAGLSSEFTVVGKNGTGVKAVVVAARNEILRYAVQQLRDRGVKTVWMAPTALASIEAAKVAGQPDSVVVEQTKDELGFDVLQAGAVVYSRTSPLPETAEGMEQEIRRTLQTAKVDDVPMVGIGGLRSDMAAAMLQPSSLELLSATQPKLVLELPEDRAGRAMGELRSRRTLAVLLCAAAFIAVALVGTTREDLAKKIAKYLRPLTTDVKKYNDRIGLMEKEIASMKPAQEMVQRTYLPAQQPTDVMITLSQATSPELWMTGVTYERGRVLQIRGTATSQGAVSSFVQALSADERFRDVTLMFANDGKIDETPVVLFSIQAHIMGNVPIIDKGKKK
jgi:Tfp pilus assembly protein PilN